MLPQTDCMLEACSPPPCGCSSSRPHATSSRDIRRLYPCSSQEGTPCSYDHNSHGRPNRSYHPFSELLAKDRIHFISIQEHTSLVLWQHSDRPQATNSTLFERLLADRFQHSFRNTQWLQEASVQRNKLELRITITIQDLPAS